MFRAFGVSIKEKRQRFEQALELMIRAWRGEPIPVENTATEGIIKTVILSPLPMQYPHPPIWVAAFGPKALAQAGHLGLPYIASPVESLDALDKNLSCYRKALIGAEHSPHQVIPIMRTTFISDKGTRVREVKATLAETAHPLTKIGTGALGQADQIQVEDWALVGEPNQIAEKIAEYRERLGMSHLIAIRTRLSSVKTNEMVRSLEHLAKIAQSL